MFSDLVDTFRLSDLEEVSAIRVDAADDTALPNPRFLRGEFDAVCNI